MSISITNYFGTTNLTKYLNRNLEWIVFHYTAGTTSKKGSAVNLAAGYKNGSLEASSDFTIDDATVVQYNKDIKNYYSWGVGGKKYPSMSTSLGGQFYGKCTNMNCINIEVCSNKTNRKSLLATDTDWYFTDSELDLAAQLIAQLMKTYNIDINHVIMHHQVTGKLCPAMWTQKESQLVNWKNFLTKVKSYCGKTSTATVTETSETYEIVKDIKGYVSAADALAGVNAKTTISKGKYYKYKEANGSINVSKTAGTAGAWINPADNVKDEEKSTTSVEPEKKKYDYPQIEIGKTIIRVKSVKASGSKKVNGNNTFTYGEFACDNDDSLIVNKSLPIALEKLKEFMNLSRIRIIRGYVNTDTTVSSSYKCNLLSRHKNGYAVDVICYNKTNKVIPAKYICCAAQLLGFPGIAVCETPAGVMTHLDVRSNSFWNIESKMSTDLRKNGYKDFFDYFSMKESDLNKYTGLDISEEKEERVKIDEETPTATIVGKIKAPKDRLVAYIKNLNPDFDSAIADAYYKIGEIYGVRGDIALCQSMLETGYFKFEGGAVTPDQYNYCGLGVTSNGMKGCSFASIENGVEAQIQHLYAYGSKDPLPNGRTLYDPRFNYVTRGVAPNWGSLNMRWAMTNIYGQTIISIYNSAIK